MGHGPFGRTEGPTGPRMGPLLYLLVSLTVLMSVGQVGGDIGSRDMGGEGNYWTDHYSYFGNCTSKPTKIFFYVNDTALRFQIEVTFDDEDPKADLVLYGPDSYVVETYFVQQGTFSLGFTDIEKRGHWSMSLGLQSCGISRPIQFEGTLNVTNRALAVPVVDAKGEDMVVGVSYKVSLDDLDLTEGESYRIDLGNGEETPWREWNGGSEGASELVSYDRPGRYELRVKVMAQDGTTTDWSEAVILHIEEGEGVSDGGPDLSLVGSVIAFLLVLMLLVVLIMSKRF